MNREGEQAARRYDMIVEPPDGQNLQNLLTWRFGQPRQQHACMYCLVAYFRIFALSFSSFVGVMGFPFSELVG